MLAARVEPRVLREKRISSIGAGVELEIGDKGFSGSFLISCFGKRAPFCCCAETLSTSWPGPGMSPLAPSRAEEVVACVRAASRDNSEQHDTACWRLAVIRRRRHSTIPKLGAPVPGYHACPED